VLPAVTPAAAHGVTRRTATVVTFETPSAATLLQTPAAVVKAATQRVDAALGTLPAPGVPPPPSPMLWAVLAWVRRDNEYTPAAATTDVGAQQANAANSVTESSRAVTSSPRAAAAPTGSNLPPALDGVLNWFRHTFDNATPTFTPQTSTVTLGEDQTSRPIALGGYDADGDTLTYTVRGPEAGSAGGVLDISGGSATYTPPSTWGGDTTYNDTFTVTASDAGSGWHIHGVQGLLHVLTFGLLGEAGDTATGTLTVHVTPSTTEPPAVEGSFPVSLVNHTGGAYRDDQIFVTVLGQTTPGNWAWVDAAGTAHPLDHTAADAPGHLAKDGVNYAKMSFTAAAATDLRIPPELEGARIYLSMGQPLYIGISPDDTGWAGPDPLNPTDPNYDTTYDWYEMTFDYGHIPFGGNTTQVDQFGLPLAFTLEQAASGFSAARGLTVTRAQVFESFAQSLPPEFQGLVVHDDRGNPLRILSPRSTTPESLNPWFDDPVNDFWAKYAAEPFSYTGPGYTVSGGVDANSEFVYVVASEDVSTVYAMSKPTSAEIFAANGPFVGAGAQGAFLAEFDAAFNRGVASDPQLWGTEAAYYPEGQRWNAYAKLFHDLSLGHYAYGFPYDDVNSRSSVLILDNTQPPSRLTISIGY